MSILNRSVKVVNLGQRIYPPPYGPLSPGAGQPPSGVIEPPAPPEPVRPETTETMPPDAVKALKELDPNADQALNDLCLYMTIYAREVKSRVKNFREMKAAADAIDRVLEKFKHIEGDLWQYMIEYCDTPADVIGDYLKKRPTWTMQFARPGQPVSVSPARPPVATPQIPPRPVTFPPPAPQPVPLRDVMTPSGMRPGQPRPPIPTQPTLPRYTDVATGGAPQYGIDLQRQIESYQQRLEEYYGRPAVTTPGALATLTPGTPRPMRPGPEVTAPQMPIQAPRPGGTPFPGTPVPTRPSCPPGQFWDGRQCRGSIAPGAEGLISAAAGGAGGMTAMGPGGISTSRGVTSAMSGRYPVVNL